MNKMIRIYNVTMNADVHPIPCWQIADTVLL